MHPYQIKSTHEYMNISLIAAMAKNRVIGNNGQIPWHIPEDFAWFKKTTLGCPVIMGRNTHESIGRILPGRTNIVLAKQGEEYRPHGGALLAGSLEEAISLAEKENPREIFIIGGGQVYAQALKDGFADKMYLTFIDKDFDGDAYFPEWKPEEWKEVWSESLLTQSTESFMIKWVIFEKP